MKNILAIEGHKAVVSFDPEIGMIRGEFLGLSGGADFYAKAVDQLYEEGRQSLAAYLDICAEKGIEPYRQFSGRFNVRLDPQLHQAAVTAAASQDLSLNDWIAHAIEKATHQG